MGRQEPGGKPIFAAQLFQTGYLTVKERRFRAGPESYLLEIPNREVKEAFYVNIIAEFTEKEEDFTDLPIRKHQLKRRRSFMTKH